MVLPFVVWATLFSLFRRVFNEFIGSGVKELHLVYGVSMLGVHSNMLEDDSDVVWSQVTLLILTYIFRGEHSLRVKSICGTVLHLRAQKVVVLLLYPLDEGPSRR